MCLITFGRIPSEKALETAQEANPDGIGAAWLTRDGVQYRKDMTVADLLALPEKRKRSIAIHFRLATVGGNTPSLIHPFPVTDRVPLQREGVAPAVIFHNGHVSDWERMQKACGGKPLKGTISDSRVLARLVNAFGDRVLHLVYGQRILYVSRSRSMLYGSGWNRIDGTWYSNDSWKERRVYSIGGSTYRRAHDGGFIFEPEEKETALFGKDWDEVDRRYWAKRAAEAVADSEAKRDRAEVQAELREIFRDVEASDLNLKGN